LRFQSGHIVHPGCSEGEFHLKSRLQDMKKGCTMGMAEKRGFQQMGLFMNWYRREA